MPSGTALAECTPRDVRQSEANVLRVQVLILDTQVDIGRGYATETLDGGRSHRAEVGLSKMCAGGLDAMLPVVCTGRGARDAAGCAAAAADAEDSYRAQSRLIDAYPDPIVLARAADEVEAMHASGRKVAFIGIDNACPLAAC